MIATFAMAGFVLRARDVREQCLEIHGQCITGAIGLKAQSLGCLKWGSR